MNNKLIEKNGKMYLPNGQEVLTIVSENHYIVLGNDGIEYGSDIDGKYLHGIEGGGIEVMLGDLENDEDIPDWLLDMCNRKS